MYAKLVDFRMYAAVARTLFQINKHHIAVQMMSELWKNNDGNFVKTTTFQCGDICDIGR